MTFRPRRSRRDTSRPVWSDRVKSGAVWPAVSCGTTGLSVQYAGQYQSIGRWNGEIDEGTGFVNGGIFFRASFLPWPRFRVAPSVYFELYSKSLSDQAFRQNTTFALTLTRFF